MSTVYQAPISEDSIIAAKFWVTETPEKTVSHFSKERTPKSMTSSQIDRASLREPLVLRESTEDKFFGNLDEIENYTESIKGREYSSYRKYWKNTFINEGLAESDEEKESEDQEESASEEDEQEEEEGGDDGQSEGDEKGEDEEINQGGESEGDDDEESSDEEASDQSSNHEEDEEESKKEQLKHIKKRLEQAKQQSSDEDEDEGSDVSDFDEDSEELDEESEGESSISMENNHEKHGKREKRVPTASNSVKNKKKKL